MSSTVNQTGTVQGEAVAKYAADVPRHFEALIPEVPRYCGWHEESDQRSQVPVVP
jgi:hypothetical protein